MTTKGSLPPSNEAPKRGRGRPKGGTPLANKAQILDAAIRAVRANGPSVTMDAIAAEAQITKPIIYRIVGDKKAVAAAIADYLSLLVEESTATILHASDPGNGRLRQAIHSYLDILRSERALFLFVEYGWGSTDGQQIATMIDRSAGPLLKQFLEGKNAGQFPNSAALTWAYATTGALRTAGLMWVQNEYCDIDELADQLAYFIQRSAPDGTPL